MSVCLSVSSCKNVTLGEEIMSSVNSTLAGSGYHLVSGRVISGQEEAVAGWITGNYLQHHLKHSVSSNLRFVYNIQLGRRRLGFFLFFMRLCVLIL